jgi:hypothetical protein
MDPISKTVVAALDEHARREKIPVIPFRRGQRKGVIAAEQRKKFNKADVESNDSGPGWNSPALPYLAATH